MKVMAGSTNHKNLRAYAQVLSQSLTPGEGGIEIFPMLNIPSAHSNAFMRRRERIWAQRQGFLLRQSAPNNYGKLWPHR